MYFCSPHGVTHLSHAIDRSVQLVLQGPLELSTPQLYLITIRYAYVLCAIRGGYRILLRGDENPYAKCPKKIPPELLTGDKRNGEMDSRITSILGGFPLSEKAQG